MGPSQEGEPYTLSLAGTAELFLVSPPEAVVYLKGIAEHISHHSGLPMRDLAPFFIHICIAISQQFDFLFTLLK